MRESSQIFQQRFAFIKQEWREGAGGGKFGKLSLSSRFLELIWIWREARFPPIVVRAANKRMTALQRRRGQSLMNAELCVEQQRSIEAKDFSRDQEKDNEI